MDLEHQINHADGHIAYLEQCIDDKDNEECDDHLNYVKQLRNLKTIYIIYKKNLNVLKIILI